MPLSRSDPTATVPNGDQDRVTESAATDDPAAFATSIGAPHQVTQTILYDPELNARGVYGNCLQAAFASLLGMPLEAVPHFVAFGSWDTALALWLADIGLTRVVEERDSIPTTGACLRAHVEKLITANTDTGAEPLTVEQWVQGIVDDALAKHEQTGQSYG